MSDDVRRLRDARDNGRGDPGPTGPPAFLGRVLAPTVSGATLGAGKYFAARPLRISGTECEGCPAVLEEPDPGRRVVVAARALPPVVGSAVPVDRLGARWAAVESGDDRDPASACAGDRQGLFWVSVCTGACAARPLAEVTVTLGGEVVARRDTTYNPANFLHEFAFTFREGGDYTFVVASHDPHYQGRTVAFRMSCADGQGGGTILDPAPGYVCCNRLMPTTLRWEGGPYSRDLHYGTYAGFFGPENLWVGSFQANVKNSKVNGPPPTCLYPEDGAGYTAQTVFVVLKCASDRSFIASLLCAFCTATEPSYYPNGLQRPQGGGYFSPGAAYTPASQQYFGDGMGRALQGEYAPCGEAELRASFNYPSSTGQLVANMDVKFSSWRAYEP